MSIQLGSVSGTDLHLDLWFTKVPITPAHKVRVDKKQLRTTFLLTGAPGQGKTMAEANLAIQSLDNGIPFAYLDLQGGGADAILNNLWGRGFFKRPDAYQRLLYLEISDGDWIPPLNFLKRRSWASANETVAQVIESFMRAYFHDFSAIGPASFLKLADASLKVLVANSLTLEHWYEILTNKEVRDRLLDPCDDLTKALWKHYDDLPAFQQASQITSSENRAYNLLKSDVLRLCISQQENLIDPYDLMRSGTSLIVNLGNLKDPAAKRLIASFLTSSFEVASFAIPANSGMQYSLILDEAGLYAAQSAQSLAEIIDFCRQRGLFTTLAFQNLAQGPDRLLASLQSSGIVMSFKVGHTDAFAMAPIFGDYQIDRAKAVGPSGNPIIASPYDQTAEVAAILKNLKPRHALLKVAGQPTVEIETITVPQFNMPDSALNEIRNTYFRKYYVHRSTITPGEIPQQKGSRFNT